MTLVFLGVFAIGSAFAGLAGAIAGPFLGTNPGMGFDILMDAFVVIVIGGFGSILRSTRGLAHDRRAPIIRNPYLPKFALVFQFVLMALVLIVRPPVFLETRNEATSLRIVVICLCLAGLGILPYLIPVTHVNMVIEIAFFSLFAMSFNMLFGYGGMLSFGHSAYFGIGAYTVAISLKHFTGLPLLLTLLMGGIAGGLGGVLAGVFCVRLKGAYFALLTMAFNQFFFAIALKWRSLTGGDDGLSIKRPDLYLPGLGTFPMNNVLTSIIW